MATIIFPSENDVGIAADDGRVATEARLQAVFRALAGAVDGVIAGMAPTAGAGLNLTVATGTAIVNGRWVSEDAALTHLLPASSTRWVFLKVTTTSGLATGTTTVDLGSAAPPDNEHVLIAKVITGATTISTIEDQREFVTRVIGGSYTGDATSNRVITVGFLPKLALVMKTSSTPHFGMTELDPSGARAHLPYRFYLEGTTASKRFGRLLIKSQTWDPGSVATATTVTQTVTVTGATTSNNAIADLDSIDGADFSGGLQVNARVTSANTVTVYLTNRDEFSAVNPGSGTLRVSVFQQDPTADRAILETSGASSIKAPLVSPPDGFKVSFAIDPPDPDNPGLNDNNETYVYLAIG